MTFIGVDAGASHVEAGFSTDGEAITIRRSRTPAPSILVDPAALAQDIAGLSDELTAITGVAASHLVAGVAGAGDPGAARELDRALRDRLPAVTVTVTTDIEVALAGSFAHERGIVVASGTGSYAALRREDGSFVRVGGWGPVIGDRGSAYDLARAALQHCAWWHDSGSEPSAFVMAVIDAAGVDDSSALARWSATAERHAIAQIARVVTDMAAARDEVAAALVERSGTLLFDLVELLRREAGTESLPVAMTGGLLGDGSPVRAALTELLSTSGFRPTDLKVDGVVGAVRLAAARTSPS